MVFQTIVGKSKLDLMPFIHCHTKSMNMIVGTFLLLCLALPALHYFSSYEFPISKVIKPLNYSSRDDQESLRKINLDPNALNISVNQDPCSGRYIYMHDLPPRFNQDLLKRCRSILIWFDLCPYIKNGGFGPRLNNTSWYSTDQFMLSVIFHTRMMQYECLTSNSSLASAIYAPFYAGLEVGQHLWGGFNSSVKDAAALDFVTWLRGKPEWVRLSGRDHFFVAGRISWDFKRVGNSEGDWGSILLNLLEVRNMTMLTIESSLGDTSEIAVPYPTHFHPSNDTEVLEWQERVRKSRKRTHLFAFAGAPRPNLTDSIRGKLISRCQSAKEKHCLLVNCLNNKLCNSPTYIIESFMKSVFCLQPRGDSYTRRSIFDSILAGCIPVFFHPKSAYHQYVWHLPKHYAKYSVFIPEDGIKNGTVNIQNLLSEIPEEDVSVMREGVIGLIPRIIYARKKLETIEDAFDISLIKILERIKETRRLNREE